MKCHYAQQNVAMLLHLHVYTAGDEYVHNDMSTAISMSACMSFAKHRCCRRRCRSVFRATLNASPVPRRRRLDLIEKRCGGPREPYILDVQHAATPAYLSPFQRLSDRPSTMNPTSNPHPLTGDLDGRLLLPLAEMAFEPPITPLLKPKPPNPAPEPEYRTCANCDAVVLGASRPSRLRCPQCGYEDGRPLPGELETPLQPNQSRPTTIATVSLARYVQGIPICPMQRHDADRLGHTATWGPFRYNPVGQTRGEIHGALRSLRRSHHFFRGF